MSPRNTFAATRRSHAILKRLRRGEGMTIQDVSDEFGIQYPQARADLKLLEELYDLDTYRDGRIKVWEMAGVGDEKMQIGIAAALELGGVALDLFKETPYGERIGLLVNEWRQRVRPTDRERMQRLSKALVLRRTWLPTRPDRMHGVLEEVLDCISLRRGLDVVYERSDGEIGEYLLIPRRLIWYEDRLWLQAVDNEVQKLFDLGGILRAEYCRREVLVERLVEGLEPDEIDAIVEAAQQQRDRDTEDEHQGAEDTDENVDEAEAQASEKAEEDDEQRQAQRRRQLVHEVLTNRVDEWFSYQSRVEEDDYFSDAFGIFATNYEAETVILRVRNSWANYMRRYKLHPSQENRELDDGLEVRLDVGLCPEFKSFVLGMVPDVEVVQPESLRTTLQERAAAWVP